MRASAKKTKVKNASHSSRVSPAKRHSRRSTSQAIVVRAPGPKPWEVKPEEAVILKNAICKGATDKELEFCLIVARRYQLDPFRKQVYFVPRRDSTAERTDGQQGGTVYVPIVSIDGLSSLAARDHRDFGTFSKPEWGPMIEVTWRYKGQGAPQKLKVPEWASIKAWKKGCAEPTEAIVYWEEIYPNINFSPTVRQMPRLMLAKCAKAQAIRSSYPATGGLYIPEETHNPAFQDITPGGRLITKVESINIEPPPEADDPKVWEFERRQAEELERTKAQQAPTEYVHCLFYQHFPESGTYKLSGSVKLRDDNIDLLKPLWNHVAKGYVATPEQLGKLISQFEDRKVPFKELQK